VTRRRALLVFTTLALTLSGCGTSSRSSVATPPHPTASAAVPSPSPEISADWTAYHRSNTRSGLGPVIPPLTSPQVAWTANVDGSVYASPLIVAGHVIVATENNTVYALDVFTGTPVWTIHLGTPVDSASLPCGNIAPVTGITGTPVADPITGRLYVVAYLHSHHHMLFALSLADGTMVWQRDVDPVGSNPTVEQQRGALSLASGYIYIPLGGLAGDCGEYHGYMEAVPVAPGGEMLFYRVPSARGAGLWTSQGATIDANGYVYVVSGNGSSESAFDYSNAVIEMTPDLQSVVSYFAPQNWAALNAGDVDLGSVGATLVPSSAAVVAIGKEGVAYRLIAGHLGGVGGQIASVSVCPGAWGGTAWSGTTIFVPCSDGLAALSIAGAGISVAWHSDRAGVGSPILAGGALWAIEGSSASLLVFDPASGDVMYSFPLGSTVHFATPAATDGFVVAPAGSRVVAIATGG
jgi:outer membrane protein assembly factor BamB